MPKVKMLDDIHGDDGNVYCPICQEMMAGYKVHDGKEWSHRCWNEDTDHIVEVEGKEVALGPRIYVGDETGNIEGTVDGKAVVLWPNV